MKVNKTYTTNSDRETFELGEEFGKNLKPGDIVCLIGALGAGKTTFVKGVAHGFKIEQTITSPTYILTRQYEISGNKNGIKTFYHLDLYRLEDEKEIKGIGFEEILNDKQGVVIIEWAEKAKNLLPAKRVNLSFEYIDENSRRIIIQKNSKIAT